MIVQVEINGHTENVTVIKDGEAYWVRFSGLIDAIRRCGLYSGKDTIGKGADKHYREISRAVDEYEYKVGKSRNKLNVIDGGKLLQPDR